MALLGTDGFAPMAAVAARYPPPWKRTPTITRRTAALGGFPMVRFGMSEPETGHSPEARLGRTVPIPSCSFLLSTLVAVVNGVPVTDSLGHRARDG